jgi:hypothetical protein
MDDRRSGRKDSTRASSRALAPGESKADERFDDGEGSKEGIRLAEEDAAACGPLFKRAGV